MWKIVPLCSDLLEFKCAYNITKRHSLKQIHFVIYNDATMLCATDKGSFAQKSGDLQPEF